MKINILTQLGIEGFILIGFICLVSIIHSSIFAQENSTGNSLSSSNQNLSGWKSYSSPVYSLEMKYPGNWVFVEEESNIRFLQSVGMSKGGSPLYASILKVNLYDLESNETIDKILRDDMSSNKFSGALNFKILGANKTKLPNGIEAGQYTNTHQNSVTNEKLKELKVIAINNGLVYVFSYIAHPSDFDEGLPIIRTMINSFKPLGFT